MWTKIHELSRVTAKMENGLQHDIYIYSFWRPNWPNWPNFWPMSRMSRVTLHMAGEKIRPTGHADMRRHPRAHCPGRTIRNGTVFTVHAFKLQASSFVSRLSNYETLKDDEDTLDRDPARDDDGENDGDGYTILFFFCCVPLYCFKSACSGHFFLMITSITL